MRILKTIRLLRYLNSGITMQGDKALEVAKEMGDLHGFWQKVGQHLSLYNLETKDIFSPLQVKGRNENRALHNFKIKHPRIAEKLKILSEKPVSCASIGQVYKCLYNNEEVALKLQYPKIMKALEFDLKVINLLTSVVRLLPNKNINIARQYLLNVAKQELEYEINYKREANLQAFFAKEFNNDSIYIPLIVKELSTETSIVSEWVNGFDIISYLNNHDKDKNSWILNILHKFYYKSLFNLNMMHADPHPGNFLVLSDKDIKIVILDFGSVITFTPVQIENLKTLLLHGQKLALNDFSNIFLNLGFHRRVVEEYKQVLPDIFSILFEPYIADREFDVNNWNIQYKLNTLLASRGWSIGLIPPGPILYLFRVIHGLHYYHKISNVAINWRQTLLECI